MPVTDSASMPSLIRAVEQADSPDRLISAVEALVAVRSEAAIPTLIRTLGYNNPGAAAVAVRGLIQLGEAAVLPLIELLDDYNYGARAYSIRALAAIADPRALEVLLTAAATDFAPSVRRAAAKGLGTLRWFQLSPEEAIAGQTRTLATLQQITQDADWSIRYAATVGMATLAQASLAQPSPQVEFASQIASHLMQQVETETDLAVQARIRVALSTIADSSSSASSTLLSQIFHQQSS